MSWIQTYSGAQFWPLKPRTRDVRLEDIAHALSLTCRFNGHCYTFYSVAQHSVLVSREVRRLGASENTVEAAILHDAAESYISDLCSPVKKEWKFYRDAEDRIQRIILRTMSIEKLVENDQRLIEKCDKTLLATEVRDLLSRPLPLDMWPEMRLPEPLSSKVIPLSPIESERMFLQECMTLQDTRPLCRDARDVWRTYHEHES